MPNAVQIAGQMVDVFAPLVTYKEFLPTECSQKAHLFLLQMNINHIPQNIQLEGVRNAVHLLLKQTLPVGAEPSFNTQGITDGVFSDSFPQYVFLTGSLF